MLIVLIVLIVELSKLIADHHVSCVSERVPHARYTRWHTAHAYRCVLVC